MISIIVALDPDNAIGAGGELLYHIREDLRRFKRLTVGNTVIMGRKTFESLPKGALPDRRNIVITRNPDFSAPGAETAPSLDAALSLASAGSGDVFIIGGGQIYAAALSLADTLEITRIEVRAKNADTWFPEIDPAQWTLVSEEDHSAAEIPYKFQTLIRNI